VAALRFSAVEHFGPPLLRLNWRALPRSPRISRHSPPDVCAEYLSHVEFKPSRQLQKPYAMVGLNIIACRQ